jgi:hypothetical protein
MLLRLLPANLEHERGRLLPEIAEEPPGYFYPDFFGRRPAFASAPALRAAPIKMPTSRSARRAICKNR